VCVCVCARVSLSLFSLTPVVHLPKSAVDSNRCHH
jgi:hypothetical protein